MEKLSSSLAVLAESSRKKALIWNLTFAEIWKMQICWRKNFHFFHVCQDPHRIGDASHLCALSPLPDDRSPLT